MEYPMQEGTVFWAYTIKNKSFSLYGNEQQSDFGSTKSTILTDRNVIESVHPEDRADVIEYIASGSKSTTGIVTYRVMAPGGKAKWMKSCGHLLQGKDTLFGWTSGFDEDRRPQTPTTACRQLELLGLEESYLVIQKSGEILSSVIGQSEKIILDGSRKLNGKNYSAVLVPVVARKLSEVMAAISSGKQDRTSLKLSSGKSVVTIEFRFTEIHNDAVLVNICNVSSRSGEACPAEKFYAFTEQSNELIMITNVEGTIEYANPMVTKVTGYSNEELLGRKTSVFNSGKHSAFFFKDLWNTVLSGKVFKGEFQNLKKDGDIFVEEKVITPLIGENGSITSIISTGRDITAQRRNAQRESKYKQLQMSIFEKEQKSRTLSLIKSNEIERKKVAHSLHEGLSQMLSAARINLESIETKQMLNTEERSKIGFVNELVSEIIKELRDISSDLSPIQLYQFGLLPVVKQMATQAMRKTSGLKIRIKSDLGSKRFKPEVEINVYRIVQEAIQNILHHSAAAKAEVSLQYKNGLLQLRISDNGKGINLNTLEFKKMSTFGILNIEARAKSIGADLSITSRLQSGFVIDVSLITKIITQ
jgi:PAS domain S-box-containing protein